APLVLLPPPPRSTLFPYTPLFRSLRAPSVSYGRRSALPGRTRPVLGTAVGLVRGGGALAGAVLGLRPVAARVGGGRLLRVLDGLLAPGAGGVLVAGVLARPGALRARLDHGLAARPLPRRQDDVEHRQQEHQDRRPVVQPQAQDLVGLVDAHVLDPEPAHAVRGDVQGERPAVSEPEAAVGPDDQPGHPQAPEGLG